MELTELNGHEQRRDFWRLQQGCEVVGESIIIQEEEKARLTQTIRGLEEERVVLLSNNERYEKTTIDLERQIDQRKQLIEKMKHQNDMLKEELFQMQRSDEEARRNLKIMPRGSEREGLDYAEHLKKLKREHLYALSKSKHETVERKLGERYDIDGFERYRVLPPGVRPSEWPASAMKTNKFDTRRQSRE